MSYYSYRATAKCKLNAATLEEAIQACVRQALFGDNNQSTPVELQDHTHEELYYEFSPYFQSFDSGEVVVFVDTNEELYCEFSPYFQYITSILCKIQSGDHLEVSWSSYDSCEGFAGGTDYYNQDGQRILIDSISNLRDKLSNIEQITNWKASDAIKLEAIRQELQ